jgi:hypothetical protein
LPLPAAERFRRGVIGSVCPELGVMERRFPWYACLDHREIEKLDPRPLLSEKGR